MKIIIPLGSLATLLTMTYDYLATLFNGNMHTLIEYKKDLNQLRKEVVLKNFTGELLLQALQYVVIIHRDLKIASLSNLDNALTADQVVTNLNTLHNDIYEKFKTPLALDPDLTTEYFVSADDNEKANGLKGAMIGIEKSTRQIFDLLNKGLISRRKDLVIISMDTLSSIMLTLHGMGYTFSTEGSDTFDLTADIETLFTKIKVLTPSDFADYETSEKTKTRSTVLQRHLPVTSQENTSPIYTWADNRLILLPKCQTTDLLIPAIIDKLMYEALRHNWQEEPCLTLRKILNKFMPGASQYSKVALQQLLQEAETTKHTYFGEFESEDSDSEEQQTFNLSDQPTQNKKLLKARAFLSRMLPKPSSFKTRMKGASDPPKPNRTKNPSIQRNITFNRRNVKADLDLINEQMKSGKPLTDKFLQELNTRFVVAQYRGIHYTTAAWDADARRTHRDLDEIKMPQFSSSVFIAAGIKSYRDYIDRLNDSPEFLKTMTEKACELQQKLQALQHSTPVSYDGKVYLSPLHLLQFWYSSHYDGYSARVARRLDASDPIFFEFLLNKDRPFLSTADLPLHSLWYAYGIKLYQGHEHERLRPRWHQNGKAERPYSGKVYISLHPPSDYTALSPSHLTSWFKYGLITLNNLVVAERETSFLGYIPSDRVAYHYKAKYPSFRGAYKPIYESKYGIDESMYDILQNGFNRHPPHSDKRRKIKRVLGEYLCAFHEVKLIDKAKRIANKNNQVLIYRTEDGLFSLYHAETPSTRNNRLNPLIMARRRLYDVIGTLNRSKQVRPVKKEHFVIKMKGHYHKLAIEGSKDLKYLPRNTDTECFRFFESKNRRDLSPNTDKLPYIPLPTIDFG